MTTSDETPTSPPVTTITPRKRPVELQGTTFRIRGIHQTNLYITVNCDEESKPFELFAQRSRSDPCNGASLEAIARLVSLCLRSGIPVEQIIRQLRGITCCPAWVGDGVKILSEPDGVAHVLHRHTDEWVEAEQVKKEQPEDFTQDEVDAITSQHDEGETPPPTQSELGGMVAPGESW